MVTLEQARAAKARLTEEVAGVPGIASVGIVRDGDDGGFALKVGIETDAGAQRLPPQVSGVRVIVESTGTIRAQ